MKSAMSDSQLPPRTTIPRARRRSGCEKRISAANACVVVISGEREGEWVSHRRTLLPQNGSCESVAQCCCNSTSGHLNVGLGRSPARRLSHGRRERAANELSFPRTVVWSSHDNASDPQCVVCGAQGLRKLLLCVCEMVCAVSRVTRV